MHNVFYSGDLTRAKATQNNEVQYLVMSDNKNKNVHELGEGVPLLHYNLPGPVGQHLNAIFHPGWHGWGQHVQRLADH